MKPETANKTANLVLRYYQREKITLDCKVVTPLFLGNADQQAEWLVKVW